ncbi:MAG: hypothetical protein J7518_17905 [Nocardioidaceae bacterium]|nr:hypothetical protein [Nocardioidaceae bacterium]
MDTNDFTSTAAAMVAANDRVPSQRSGDDGWEDGAVTLAEFLMARYDEEEAMARATSYNERDLAQQPHSITCGYRMTELSVNPECICRWPDRVLAECEANRCIVGLHTGPDYWDSPDFHLCADSMINNDECPTLRALALPYADHEDYQPEWAGNDESPAATRG